MNNRRKSPEALSRIAQDLRPLAVPLKSLKEDPENPRLHDGRNIEAIKALLVRYGQQRTVLVSKDGFIVAGNGVFRAASELGWTHLAAVRSGRKLSELRELAIGDNKSAELSEWDEAVLAGQLAELQAEGFNPDDIGFSREELEQLSAAIEQTAAGVGEDEPPDELPAGVQPVKAGKADVVFTLGSHRFFVARKKYEAWLEDIRQSNGFDNKSVLAEIRRRLRI